LLFSRYLLVLTFSGMLPASDFLKTGLRNRFFKWGVAAASYQTEGAWNLDGKSEIELDHFLPYPGQNRKRRKWQILQPIFTTGTLKDIDLIKL